MATISGQAIQEGGGPARSVWLLDGNTGELLQSATPDGNGNYSLTIPAPAEIYIMFTGGPGFRAIAEGPISITD